MKDNLKPNVSLDLHCQIQLLILRKLMTIYLIDDTLGVSWAVCSTSIVASILTIADISVRPHVNFFAIAELGSISLRSLSNPSVNNMGAFFSTTN